MAKARIDRIFALGALLSLAGCADQGSFPSLAPRPVERLSNDEPVRVAPMVATNPALTARIAELLRNARGGETEFQAALPAARASVSRAEAAESESWIEAQQAISRLEAKRAATVTALAQLDTLSVERARLPIGAGDFEALLAAVETARSLAAGQQAEINRLRGALRPV